MTDGYVDVFYYTILSLQVHAAALESRTLTNAREYFVRASQNVVHVTVALCPVKQICLRRISDSGYTT